MRLFQLILFLVFAANFTFAQDQTEPLKLKQTIGFDKIDDSIIRHKFVENGKKVFLLGGKNIQLWDVENGKLLNSVPHNISELKPESFFSKYFLLGIPEKLKWEPFYFELNGKWIITIEKEGNSKAKSAVVRDSMTSKILASLDLPNSIPTDSVAVDTNKNEIITTGQKDEKFAFAIWDKDSFQLKRIITIDDFRWWQLLSNETKMVVGTGGFKLFNFFGQNQGTSLTLRDVKTSVIEKEFTATSLNPKTSFEGTTISKDEKHLVSRREKRIFVWDINGNGLPKLEISQTNPKEKVELRDVFGGSYLVVSVDKSLRIYDLSGDGKPKFEFAPTTGPYFYGASNDGKYFAVSNLGKIAVYETSGNGKPLYEFAPHDEKEYLYGGSFDESGKYFLLKRYNRKKDPPEKMEFYNLENGKSLFETPSSRNYKLALTPDKKFLYTENLGSTFVWNFTESKIFSIGLYTETPSETDSDGNTTYGSERNIEFTKLSPDGKLVLKYGKYLTTVYDIATGKEIQTIFDAERVKYDKQNKIKDSGLNEAGWTDDGKYVFAYSDSGKTISFWERAN